MQSLGEGVKKTRLFGGHVALAMTSPPLITFRGQKKVDFYSPFFYTYQIEPEYTEWTIFIKEIKKLVVIDLPDTKYTNNTLYDMYTLYFYGSPDYKTG